MAISLAIACFLLVAGAAMLLSTILTVPLVPGHAFITIDVPSYQLEASLGTLGWCTVHGPNGDETCSRRVAGYDPVDALMPDVTGIRFGEYSEHTMLELTRSMLLYPIATTFCFASLGLAAWAVSAHSRRLSLAAGAVAFLTFAVTITAFVCSAILHGILRSFLHDVAVFRPGSLSPDRTRAHYSGATWVALTAAVCVLLAAVLLFIRNARVGPEKAPEVEEPLPQTLPPPPSPPPPPTEGSRSTSDAPTASKPGGGGGSSRSVMVGDGSGVGGVCGMGSGSGGGMQGMQAPPRMA